MKSKKGFTLLEVLLVIDILVIISLIAIPIVMSNIDSARKQTFKSDVNSVFRSAEINLRTTVPSEMTCYSLGYADVTHKDKFISGQVCKDSNHNYEVKNLCTKDYCFNGPLETGTQVDSYIDKLPVIKEFIEWNPATEFHETTYKTNIVSIEVLTHKNVPSNAVKSWDVSATGDGSVMAWVVKNSVDNTKYDLFIGGEGGVKANPNSWSLFMGFTSAKIINLEHLYTHEVTNMREMFRGCISLINLNIQNFNTSNVATMMQMFFGCQSLKQLDLSHFNTSKVERMSSLFYECKSLLDLDVSSFETSRVRWMNYMFYDCVNLLSLNISNFDTSSVDNMDSMFRRCCNLKELNLSNFNTSKVTQMDYMFDQCLKLENLNISNFDTSVVTDMSYMFSFCKAIKHIDLKSFDTGQLANARWIFGWTSSLERVDVTTGKWVLGSGITSNDMFTGSQIDDVTYNS